MPKELSPKTALNRAQWLCSQREKCISEIRLKLNQWQLGAEDVLTIIKSLVDEGYINEGRYALAFAREKARFNKWGPKKIELALKAKRIGNDDIQHALTEVEPFTSTENLTDLLTKKVKSIKFKDKYDLKNKLIRFALSRGFDYGDVLGVVEGIVKEGMNE
jgi:regulatory protein